MNLNSFTILTVVPDLVQETSRVGLYDIVAHPIKTIEKIRWMKKDVMDGIILNPKVEQQLRFVFLTIYVTRERCFYEFSFTHQ